MLKTLTVPEIIANTENAERTGNYIALLEAIQALGFLDFENPGTPDNLLINTNGLDDWEIAELCLAFARIYGYHSITKTNAQEICRNLLTLASDSFQALNNYPDKRRKQLICSNYLALTETRVGAYDKAEAWLSDALSFTDFADNDPSRLHTFIVESLINIPNGKNEQVLARLDREKQNFIDSRDLHLQGLYYMNRGAARLNVRDITGALNDQLTAGHIFKKSGHGQLLSFVKNNLAFHYLTTGDTRKGFNYAGQALAAAVKSFGIREEACVRDTLALLYCDEGRYGAALIQADQSIAILEKTECYRYLLDSLKTKFEILWKLNRIGESLGVFADARALAVNYCTPADRERIEQTMANLTREGSESYVSEKAAGNLVFDGYVPTGAISEIEVTAVCHTLLKPGHLAIAEEMQVSNGDFSALEHLETGECYLGYISLFADCVGLQYDENSDPNVFSESEVRILGKVIGYCPDPPDADGYYKVVSFE